MMFTSVDGAKEDGDRNCRNSCGGVEVFKIEEVTDPMSSKHFQKIRSTIGHFLMDYLK